MNYVEPLSGPAARGEQGAEPVRIEVSGLSVYTHHGVTQAERELGQRLVIDVAVEVRDCRATTTDDLADTVDYGGVAREVADAAAERSHSTLERLCADVADRVLGRFGADSVTVRAAKPEPPMPLVVEEVAVELTRERG